MTTETSTKFSTSWNTHDPDWMRMRRDSWKRIEEKLKTRPFAFLRVTEKSKLRSFYLKGYSTPQEPTRDDDYPLKGVDSPALFEYWLSPDHSDENLRFVFSRISDEYEKVSTRSRFRSLIVDLFPEEGSLFDGLEEKLYYQVGRTRCRSDVEYPDQDEISYLSTCTTHFLQSSAVINRTLFAVKTSVNTCDIPMLMIPEFLDSYDCSYLDAIASEQSSDSGFSRKEYGYDDNRIRQIQRCIEIKKTDDYHPRQCELASQLISGLSTVNLNKELKDLLAPYLDASDRDDPKG